MDRLWHLGLTTNSKAANSQEIHLRWAFGRIAIVKGIQLLQCVYAYKVLYGNLFFLVTFYESESWTFKKQEKNIHIFEFFWEYCGQPRKRTMKYGANWSRFFIQGINNQTQIIKFWTDGAKT